MYQAKQLHRSLVIKILTQSFADNPTLNFIIRDGKDQSKYIAAVAEYAFDFALRRNGVWLSNSGKGVAICFRPNLRRQDFVDLFYLLRLLIKGISIRKVCQVLRHRKMITALRPNTDHQLYFWFFGVHPEESPRTSAWELSQEIITMADRRKLDIYAETTLRQNMLVYKRFGFQVYQQWLNPENGINVWFMRKPSVAM